MSHLTFLEAAVVGLIQGVSEMFPVSSLGHNVLIPALVGGSWARDLNVASPESPYLAFIVGLHVATALALLIYFWRDWVRIIGGFFSSIRDRSVATDDQRLAWMIVLATIPVGIAGVAFEHAFRVIFGKPVYAAIFLAVNGVILIAGERYRTRASLAADAAIAAERRPAPAAAVRQREFAASAHPPAFTAAGRPAPQAGRHRSGGQAGRPLEMADAARSDQRLASMGYPQAVAVRFAFLLATPVILAAGALKIPDLFGPLGNGIRGQILLASVLSGVGAYLSVRFLLRYLRTRTLTPFGVYCLVAGLASVIYLGLIK